MESNSGPDDVERIKILYEETGDEREPFWSSDNWGPLIPEIQFGEGQFRDLLIEALREHGIEDRGHGRSVRGRAWLRMGTQSPPVRGNGNSCAQYRRDRPH